MTLSCPVERQPAEGCVDRAPLSLLASVDKARQTLKVRRMIEGGSRQVLHVRVDDLLGRNGSG